MDKRGERYEIRACNSEDCSSIICMYDDFLPRPASQGLPPEDRDTRNAWIKTLMVTGINLLAWRGDLVIGHVALIPDPRPGSGELVIFVHQDSRNLGIGTTLTRVLIDKAFKMGYRSIWLTVGVSNFIAIRLYTCVGFRFVDMDPTERIMRIDAS